MIRESIRKIALILCFALFSHAPWQELSAEPPLKRALLIGINDYSGRNIAAAKGGWQICPQELRRSSFRNLAGAVNDVKQLKEMLGPFGFRDEDIRLLTNQQATREAILGSIEDHLLAAARQGSHLLFYYSGHGSQVVNSLSPEEDGRDESLVPADARLGAPDIRDKELRRLFNRILDRGARLTIILDSCNSGSAARGLPTNDWPRALEINRCDVADGAEVGPRLEDRSAVIMSAAQDFEYAWETEDEDGVAHGAFTLTLLWSLHAGGNESAEDVFLRTRARLQRERIFQQPVRAGKPSLLADRLFGGRVDQRGSRTVVAAESFREGRVTLQGGWANGLAVGSVLESSGRDGDQPTRLKVSALHGLSRSQAQVLESVPSRGADGAAEPFIEPGTLFELTGWASPPQHPLHVWVPQAEQYEAIRKWVGDLARLVADSEDIQWVDDPTANSPSHVLRWLQGGWQLLGPDRTARHLGASLPPDQMGRFLKGKARLFVQVPFPAGLVKELSIGPGTDQDAVLLAGADRAHYVLAGRLTGDRVEFAWVRPAVVGQDSDRSGMPVRSDWRVLDAESRDSLPLRLQDTVLRLAKIYAWQSLQSPPNEEFPYSLQVVEGEEGRPVQSSVLEGGGGYGILLKKKAGAPDKTRHPRFVYVFVIDGAGNSVLLYPERNLGSVENRHPADNRWPSQILLQPNPLFEIVEPYGPDTYFLLTSAEPIPSPEVLEFSGVRTRGPEGSTPLEELLSQTGSTLRAARSLTTPVTWSIERRFFRSIPAHGERK